MFLSWFSDAMDNIQQMDLRHILQKSTSLCAIGANIQASSACKYEEINF